MKRLSLREAGRNVCCNEVVFIILEIISVFPCRVFCAGFISSSGTYYSPKPPSLFVKIYKYLLGAAAAAAATAAIGAVGLYRIKQWPPALYICDARPKPCRKFFPVRHNEEEV